MPRIPGHPRARRRHVVAVARADRDRGRPAAARACPAARRSRRRCVSNTAWSKPTRSILFTASTNWRMPSSEAIAACRRVCASRPLRASTSSTARSASRGAGHHVAGVLLVPGRIGQDEAPARRLEEAVGDVDGDALLALGGQAIDQQRIVGAALDGAEAAGSRAPAPPSRRRGWCRIRTAAGRSASICRHRPCRRPGRAGANRASEIALALLLLHRGVLVLKSISRPARSDMRVVAHLGDDLLDGWRRRTARRR